MNILTWHPHGNKKEIWERFESHDIPDLDIKTIITPGRGYEAFKLELAASKTYSEFLKKLTDWVNEYASILPFMGWQDVIPQGYPHFPKFYEFLKQHKSSSMLAHVSGEIVAKVLKFYGWDEQDGNSLTEGQIWIISESFNYLLKHRMKFVFDIGKQLERYLQEPAWKTKAECYRRYYGDGDKQKIIARDLVISQSSVANYIDEVQGRLSLEMGHAYEDYFASVVAPVRYDRYVRMGGKGEPDGIGYKGDSIEVLNLKCHNATRGSSDTIHRSGLRAEIEYARKLIQEGSKNVKVKLIYHELSRNLDFERDVDIGDEGQKITINFEAPTPSV